MSWPDAVACSVLFISAAAVVCMFLYCLAFSPNQSKDGEAGE